MNYTQKVKLAACINVYVRAAVDSSWKGSSPPDEAEDIERYAKKCHKAMNDALNAATTNDSERLNLLLDTMLAVSNDMKLPPAGQLVMDAMQDHVANGNIITGDDMKGILDVALTTIPVGATTAEPETVCAEGNIGGDAYDTASAAASGNCTQASECESPCS